MEDKHTPRRGIGGKMTAGTKLFTPSSSALLAMIERANAKCDADIAQTALRTEARAAAALARSISAEARSRLYARIQRGEA